MRMKNNENYRETKMKLTTLQLRELLIGVTFFSTGGGGSLELGLKLVDKIEEIELIDLSDIDPLKMCATSYLVGSIKAPPLEELKRMHKNVCINDDSDLILSAFNILQKNFPEKIDIIVPIELGGHNTAVTLYLADKLELPVLDADLTGRSAPEMYQTGYYVGDIPPTPAAVYTPFGEKYYIENINDYKRLDDVFRELVTLCYDYDIGVANFPLPIKKAAPYMQKNTLTLSIKVGSLLQQKKIDEAINLAGGKIIFQGRPVEENSEIKDGFTYGKVKIKGTDGDLILEYKNEIMLAKLNGEIIASVPDLIGSVTQNGNPILNTKFPINEEVIVYTLPSQEIWKSGKGRSVFCLEHFGY